jgi:hypothetical protein
MSLKVNVLTLQLNGEGNNEPFKERFAYGEYVWINDNHVDVCDIRPGDVIGRPRDNQYEFSQNYRYTVIENEFYDLPPLEPDANGISIYHVADTIDVKEPYVKLKVQVLNKAIWAEIKVAYDRKAVRGTGTHYDSGEERFDVIQVPILQKGDKILSRDFKIDSLYLEEQEILLVEDIVVYLSDGRPKECPNYFLQHKGLVAEDPLFKMASYAAFFASRNTFRDDRIPPQLLVSPIWAALMDVRENGLDKAIELWEERMARIQENE